VSTEGSRFEIGTILLLRDNRMMDKTYLAKLKDSDPEQFMFITVNMAEGRMVHTSSAMSEEEIRKLLIGNGMPLGELEEKFAHARASAVQ
jgi:hypothetical protein